MLLVVTSGAKEGPLPNLLHVPGLIIICHSFDPIESVHVYALIIKAIQHFNDYLEFQIHVDHKGW